MNGQPTLAEQIKQSVDNRVAADRRCGVARRTRFEAEEKRAALQGLLGFFFEIRGYELWVQADRPENPGNFDKYITQARSEATYITKARESLTYRTDGTVNAKEALSFLKDWSTSLVQLDTAAIGAIGLFLGFSDLARSPILNIGNLHHLEKGIAIAELLSIGLSALSFFVSLVSGLFLLNALPGAIQRVPIGLAEHRDVFSIANTEQHRTINFKSSGLRYFFLGGAFFFAVSIILGICRATLTSNIDLTCIC